MKNLLLIAFIVLIAPSFAFAQSEKDGWVKLATKTVNYKNETDEISLLGKTKDIDKIKLTCVQGTVKLKSVSVEMSDGKTKEYDPKGAGLLTKGTSSFNFNLPGNEAKLKSLFLEYDSVGNPLVTKRGKIEVWGKKRQSSDKQD